MPVNDDAKATAQSGAIKVDVGSSTQDVVGRISFGDRCYGGELVFVPRHQDASALKGEPARRTSHKHTLLASPCQNMPLDHPHGP